MLRTRLCDLLGIQYPIIQAGMGPFTSAELVAAVSNAGGIGTIGASARSVDGLRRQLARTRELTSRPFAVNHTLRALSEEAFAITLAAKPALISFALGEPGDLVQRAHDDGIIVMHQVTTVKQAYRAVELGVDIINAQGGEAGGFGGAVATLALVPQVVEAVSPIPVVASGGIADGRGLAAAMVLGAQGVNIGTRFLATPESPISDAWKKAIMAAASEDAIKFDAWNDILPLEGSAYFTIPRVLSTPFVDRWQTHRSAARRARERLQKEIMTAMQEGRWGDLTPFTGQTAGLIHEILPAGETVRRVVTEAEEALRRTTKLLT